MKKQDLLNLKKLLLSGLISTTAVVKCLNATSIDVHADSEIASNMEKEAWSHVKHYCDVFGLDYVIVYSILQEKSMNFESYEWRITHDAEGNLLVDSEMAILNLISDIYYNPGNYEVDKYLVYPDQKPVVSENDVEDTVRITEMIPLTKEMIRTQTEYTPKLSAEEMVEKYCSIYGVNKEVAMAICYAECGTDMGSHNYRVNNNPAGLAGMKFQNKEIGIIHYVHLLKTSYGATLESDDNFLRRIASKYCELPDHWLSLNLPAYRNLCNDYYYYRPDLKENSISENTLVKTK